MKKLSAFICLVALVFAAAPVLARGGYYGYYHNPPPPYYSYPRHHGHHDGDIIAGVAVGLLTGVILGQAFAPPPAPVYTPRYYYAPPVVVEQQRVCVEERVVSGEWQQNPYDGVRYWVTFPYPMKRRYEVPCY